jgi:hypothetical protein
MELLGVNSLGIRLDSRRLDHWVRLGKKVDEVINELETVDFNPEFQKIPYPLIKKELISQLT